MGKLKEFWNKVEVSVETFNGIEFGIRHVDSDALGYFEVDGSPVLNTYQFGVLVSFAFLSFLFAVKK